jgi:S1-C subfamily serine protease
MLARTSAALVAGLLIAGVGGLVSVAGAQAEPPRRHVVLPGLEPHELLVDPSVEWHDRAVAGIDRARRSAVALQNAEHPDWPPLSGFVISPRHVVTAHLSELRPGEVPPRYLVRMLDGSLIEGVQVAGWRRWDFGVIELDTPTSAPPIEFGDDRAMRSGDIVLNVGSPSAAGRTGLLVTTVGTFARLRDGILIGDVSTLAGGSGSPVVDLDGRLIGMTSFGTDGLVMADIDSITVSDLQLRSAVPVDRGPGSAGASASTIASLTAPYRQ